MQTSLRNQAIEWKVNLSRRLEMISFYTLCRMQLSPVQAEGKYVTLVTLGSVALGRTSKLSWWEAGSRRIKCTLQYFGKNPLKYLTGPIVCGTTGPMLFR